MIVEERVRRLVDELNLIPGIYTFSSCGGHSDPQPGQSEDGVFEISFSVFPLEGGWFGLERIAFAIWMDLSDDRSGELARTDMTAWWNGGERFDEGWIDFALTGTGDPDELAETLVKVGRGDFGPPSGAGLLVPLSRG
jgi:hypothetical protein